MRQIKKEVDGYVADIEKQMSDVDLSMDGMVL